MLHRTLEQLQLRIGNAMGVRDCDRVRMGHGSVLALCQPHGHIEVPVKSMRTQASKHASQCTLPDFCLTAA